MYWIRPFELLDFCLLGHIHLCLGLTPESVLRNCSWQDHKRCQELNPGWLCTTEQLICFSFLPPLVFFGGPHWNSGVTPGSAPEITTGSLRGWYGMLGIEPRPILGLAVCKAHTALHPFPYSFCLWMLLKGSCRTHWNTLSIKPGPKMVTNLNLHFD